MDFIVLNRGSKGSRPDLTVIFFYVTKGRGDAVDHIIKFHTFIIYKQNIQFLKNKVKQSSLSYCTGVKFEYFMKHKLNVKLAKN